MQPCEACKKHGSVCIYDRSQPKRRGPRPRAQTHTQHQRLAPAPAAARPVVSFVGQPLREISETVSPRLPCYNTANADASEVELACEGEVYLPPEIEVTTVDDSDDEREDDAQDLPPLDLWRETLRGITTRLSIPGLTANVIAHLIELFWSCGDSSLRLMIGQESFFTSLMEDRADHALCLAICACAARFSCHASLETGQNGAVAARFEAECRKLIDFATTSITLGRIQAFCVLADCNVMNGAGARSWVDTGVCPDLYYVSIIAETPRYRQKPLANNASVKSHNHT